MIYNKLQNLSDLKCILIRVDGNKRLGMGHLSRCFELAKKLKKLKITPYFFLKYDKNTIELIKEEGFPFFTFLNSSNEEKEVKILINLHHKIKYDCIVIDLKKHKNKKFFDSLNKICKTVVIDNTNKNSLNANLIIWPWVKEQYSKNIIKNNPPKILVGPKYMQLGNFQKNIKKIKLKNSILVSMGGSDKRNLTVKIIDTFQKTNYDFHMGVVIGKFFSDKEKIYQIIKNDKRFTIISKNKSLISLMSKYKIGIFSFGITTCEAFFVGLPSFVISHSKENDDYAKKTANYECMKYLGYYKKYNFNEMPQTIFSLMKDSKLCKKYTTNGQNMIDGRGNERIAKKIFQMIN